eukprot:4668900-Pleurochrysis_carterae.AAC.1
MSLASVRSPPRQRQKTSAMAALKPHARRDLSPWMMRTTVVVGAAGQGGRPRPSQRTQRMLSARQTS